MERRHLFNLLLGNLLFLGILLSSCGSDDLKKEVVPGDRMLTFDVSESFGGSSDAQVRAFSEKPDTIYQGLGNGMEIKVVIEEEKIESSRTLEGMVDGVAVLAIVYNTTTYRVHRVQNLTIINGKLTCMVPNDRNVKIAFYSYNTSVTPTTSLVEGDLITTVDTANEAVGLDTDILWTESPEITPSVTSLGTMTFKHLFARIQTTMTCFKKKSIDSVSPLPTAPTFTNFEVLMDAQSACRYAAINIVLGTLIPDSTNPIPTMMHGYSSKATTITSDFELFIPADTESHLLSFYEVDSKPVFENPVPFNKKFEGGHSYTIKVSLYK